MRKKCIVCGAELFDKPIYVCKNMPKISQNLPVKENLCEDRPVDFNLCQCSGCGLVQFDCDPVPYYLDSTRAGERSAILIKICRDQYSHFIEKCGLKGKKILEIGAGKGGFLKTLKEMTEYGIQEYGIEHNEEFVKTARDKYKVNVAQGNPEEKDTIIEGAPFDAFVSFAYPARLINPNGMLQHASRNLIDEGFGLIRVASWEHLLRPGGFYDITADHIAYYSKGTLAFLLNKNGFDILEQGEIGIYNYAIVQKRSPCHLDEFWSDVEVLSTKVKKYVDDLIQCGKKIAVWCAGHFAFTVLSTSGIGDSIAYIIDNAPFKQGKYSPATHIPIFGPEHLKEEPVNTILILGPTYIDEIVKEIRQQYSQTVNIAVMNWNELREVG